MLFEIPMVITFEGLDGCGKSKLTKAFTDYLENATKDQFVTIAEPSCETLEGFDPRQILKDPSIDKVTEVLIASAYRRENVSKLIRPALDAGKSVIQDRFVMSTYCYNVYPYKETHPELEQLFMSLMPHVIGQDDGFPEPLMFIIDVPTEVRMERMDSMDKPLDRYEIDSEYQAQVAMAYDELKAMPSVVVLDGTKTVAELLEEVVTTIEQYQTKLKTARQELVEDLENDLVDNRPADTNVTEDSTGASVETFVSLEDSAIKLTDEIFKGIKEAAEQMGDDPDVFDQYHDLVVKGIIDTMVLSEEPPERILEAEVRRYLTDEFMPMVFYGHKLNNIKDKFSTKDVEIL